MRKIKVKEDISLKEFIAKQLDISKNRAKQLIDSKVIFVNNKRVWIASHQLKKGDIVELPPVDNDFSWSIEKGILYEDSFIIAVNKPPFIESEGTKESIEYLLKGFKKNHKIRAIHRLDRETSGVLLFAKDSRVFEKFKKLWQEKKVEKVYWAISHNEATFKKKVINIPVDGKYAKSFIYTHKVRNGFSLFRIEIPTGRKHQIRIHLSKIRHPVVGDKIYGLKNVENPLLKNVKRQMLHAQTVSFFHPFLKKKIKINAPHFPDFVSFGKIIRLL